LVRGTGRNVDGGIRKEKKNLHRQKSQQPNTQIAAFLNFSSLCKKIFPKFIDQKNPSK
jgi:hypothetical protein